MAGFDPDAYLAAPRAAQPAAAPAFDPDAYLSKQDKSMSLGDVGSAAATWATDKLVPSAVKFGADIAHPFIHPLETFESMENLGAGSMHKFARSGVMDSILGERSAPIPRHDTEKYPEAVGEFFKDRYGGMENIKNTLVNDPVGAMGDAASVLTLGGGAAARAPGMVGTIGRVTRGLGSAIDPISLATRGVKAGGSLAAGVIGNFGTQTGGQALRTAARAGYAGGDSAKAFRENLRGTEPLEATVQEARDALKNIRESRGDAYRSGMIPVANDKTILSFDQIDRALTTGVGTFKGEEVNKAASAVRAEMWDAVEKWKNLTASEYHTAEGFDALKKKLGAIREGIPYEQKTARAVANDIYGAVNQTIRKQAPEYAKVMKGYEEASNQIKELEKTLSLNPNASIDTSLRKLQSALRDNVHTSFGRRKELAELLMKSGAPHLMERLAGQALKPWAPRGLAKLLGLELAASGHGSYLSMMSPRLAGEAAYYGGRAMKAAPKTTLPLQPGRIASQLDPREMAIQDAKSALRDRETSFTKDERERIRRVARGSAAAAEIMSVKKLLEGKSPQERISEGFSAMPQQRASYGGPT